MLHAPLFQTWVKVEVSVCYIFVPGVDITCQILFWELDGLVPLDVVQLLLHTAKTTDGLKKGLCFIWLYSFVASLVLTIFSIDEQQRPYFSFMVLHIMSTPWHSPAYRPCSWQGPVMVKITSWHINNLKKQLPELSSNIWDGSGHRLSVGQVNPKKMEG